MDRDFFIQKENWHGSFYELAIELQTSQDDFRLEQALKALWRYPNLNGCWLKRENFGQGPDTFSVSNNIEGLEENHFMRMYGTFYIPELGKQVGCLSIVVRETNGSDWLDFCIPTEMLEKAFSVEYPLLTDDYPWETVLDKYFLQMAELIYKQTPYDLALVGDEVSGLINKLNILSAGIENQINTFGLSKNKILFSPQLWNDILLDKTHEVLPSGLKCITFAK
jgi:hypothetical protein